MNVAAPSLRRKQKKTALSEFNTEPGIQKASLEQLQEAHPKGRYWIKLDACDLKPALQQSTREEWDGDVDLGEGRLQQLRQSYDQRCSLLTSCCGLSMRDDLQAAMRSIIADLEEDTAFLGGGLVRADEEEAPQPVIFKKHADGTVLGACWVWHSLATGSSNKEYLWNLAVPPAISVPPRHRSPEKNIKEDHLTYLRNLFIKMRQPVATHVLVFLLSDERRNTKPYALPIQYVPYRSIKDQYVRDVTNNIKIGQQSASKMASFFGARGWCWYFVSSMS